MEPYWEFMREFNIPMSINMNTSQTRALLKVAEMYPDQIFLLSHMVRPIITDEKLNRKAYEPVLSLREFKNIYIKLSGFYAFVQDGWRYPQRAVFGVIDILKKRFGVKRLLWGSDFTPVLEFNTYRQSFEIINSEYRGFDKDELERIFYKNSFEIVRERKGWIRQFTNT
jgi:predicted TIM-barrel fold metal-dependent hydrolase